MLERQTRHLPATQRRTSNGTLCLNVSKPTKKRMVTVWCRSGSQRTRSLEHGWKRKGSNTNDCLVWQIPPGFFRFSQINAWTNLASKDWKTLALRGAPSMCAKEPSPLLLQRARKENHLRPWRSNGLASPKPQETGRIVRLSGMKCTTVSCDTRSSLAIAWFPENTMRIPNSLYGSRRNVCIGIETFDSPRRPKVIASPTYFWGPSRRVFGHQARWEPQKKMPEKLPPP
mmetsp:Transcript_3344/g.6927  ORF Transcript_3344/g.6927 Transcript_3344/m.6927 type:complete len:229 (-) Transcript_3344:614-1300(-)